MTLKELKQEIKNAELEGINLDIEITANLPEEGDREIEHLFILPTCAWLDIAEAE